MSLYKFLAAAITLTSTTLLFSLPTTHAQYSDDLLQSDLYSRSAAAAFEDLLFDAAEEALWARDFDLDEEEDLLAAALLARADDPPKKKLSYAPSSVLSPLEPFKTGGKKLPHYLNPTSLCPEHKLVCVHAGKGAVKVPGLGHGDYRTCPTCGKFC